MNVPHLKSRSGCNTCKRRKVKCDEVKPFCRRCLSSARLCEGYGIIIKPSQPHAGTDNLDLEPLNSASFGLPKLAAAISSIPRLGHVQQHKFAFTAAQTVNVTYGLRSLSFWQNVILPACHQEPSVLHAVLALAYANHRERVIDPDRVSGDARTNHLHMIMEYNQAIQSLKGQVNGDDMHSLRVTLITCILFIALELRTGRVTKAMTHLDEGRKVFLSLGTHVSLSRDDGDGHTQIILPSKPQSIDEELLAILADMDIQATYFGSGRPQWKLVALPPRPGQSSSEGTKISTISNSAFTSMHEAHQHLTILLNEILQFTGTHISCEQHTMLNQASNLQRGHLMAGLNQWRDLYQRLCLSSLGRNQTDEPWKRHSALMLIHHAWLTVLLSLSYWEKKETACDTHIDHFTTIVYLASTVLPPENQAVGRTTTHSFSLEFGLILPLWLTAMKCRQPRVRRDALPLLRRAGNEGLWDAKLVGLLAQEMIKLEEGIERLQDGGHDAVSFAAHVDLSQLIPLNHRVSDVEIHSEDDDSPVIVASFERKQWDLRGDYLGKERIVKRLAYPADSISQT